MAKQKGIIKLEGSIGDISFYKGRDGNFIARTKTGISSDRIKNDPAFARTRENGKEFGQAGKAGKLIRAAFREVINSAKDSRMSNRLTRELLAVVQGDNDHVRGERIVQPYNIELIKGFEFNKSAQLGSVMVLPFTTTINRTEGSVIINLPSFVPASSIVSPSGSTHANFVIGVSELDFSADTYLSTRNASSYIPINNETQEAIELDCEFTAESTSLIFVVFGIEFYQEVNGQYYPLKNGSSNAISIVETYLADR